MISNGTIGLADVQAVYSGPVSADCELSSCDPCSPPSAELGSPAVLPGPLAHFAHMIDRCYDYATAGHRAGRPVVGILCEYAPRELILAAGGIPVCLCGGSAHTIVAAEEELPANLCPLIKSTYGYHMLKSNPFLEMADLIVGETTCDGKKKMIERLSESRPVFVLELPQREGRSALPLWQAELEGLKQHMEALFGITITAEGLRDAIRGMNRERALRRALASLMTRDAPPLTGRMLLDLKSSVSAIPADLDAYESALRFLRAAPGLPDATSRVRVLLTGVPIVHGAERVVDIIEGAGGLVVCMENCTGLKPILEDVDESAGEPMRSLAEKYLGLPCSVKTPNDRRIESLRALAIQYRPDCIIDLVWQACLTYDIESYRVRRLAEEELGLPFLRIETDYSPSDTARIAVRVEALFETARARVPKREAPGGE